MLRHTPHTWKDGTRVEELPSLLTFDASYAIAWEKLKVKSTITLSQEPEGININKELIDAAAAHHLQQKWKSDLQRCLE